MGDRILGRWKHRGFVGERYEGLSGRLRFLWQHFVIRTDFVLVAERDNPLLRVSPEQTLELIRVNDWAAFAPFSAELDAAYHPGYAEAWRRIFAWGESLVIARDGGRVAGFGWLQTGTPDGINCPYAKVFAGEYRVLRVGVLPGFRRRSVNTRFYAQLLERLFSEGGKRVYVDCAKDNLPSLRAQVKAGFRPVGEIRIVGELLGGRASWWRPLALPDEIRKAVVKHVVVAP
ncbi:MAG: GNAT family N-acetyltransferase [Gemmatimonadales bacterium]